MTIKARLQPASPPSCCGGQPCLRQAQESQVREVRHDPASGGHPTRLELSLVRASAQSSCLCPHLASLVSVAAALRLGLCGHTEAKLGPVRLPTCTAAMTCAWSPTAARATTGRTCANRPTNEQMHTVSQASVRLGKEPLPFKLTNLFPNVSRACAGPSPSDLFPNLWGFVPSSNPILSSG